MQQRSIDGRPRETGGHQLDNFNGKLLKRASPPSNQIKIPKKLIKNSKKNKIFGLLELRRLNGISNSNSNVISKLIN